MLTKMKSIAMETEETKEDDMSIHKNVSFSDFASGNEPC
jgi:hypothetical protein